MCNFKLIQNDPYLEPYHKVILRRHALAKELEISLTGGLSLSDFSNGHNYFGLHKNEDEGVWVFREWAPAAKEVYLIGDFSGWKPINKFKCYATINGQWELKIPLNTLKHLDLYKLFIIWEGGCGERIPAWTRRVVQEPSLKVFNAQVWAPKKYIWQHESPKSIEAPLVYEAHIGMSSNEPKVSSFKDFTQNIIPHIIESGYNTIQLMAIQEHPYYASFGYHVSSFFAVSSFLGTPDDLKELIDTAHAHGLKVIMDLVHSHAVKNENEGLSRFDGTLYQYFHDGSRGNHEAWDSRCFNYSKKEVLHFLLSNCKFWLEEYKFDGFRFDGVTSMLYLNHGLESDFNDYKQYFDENQDEEAISYLILANKLIHDVKPSAITVAEEMSGMPGLASSIEDGGIGFDYRLAMGVPDFWIKLIKEVKDEFWHVGDMFYNLSNKRFDEKVISYAESHDQALVGDQTIIFRLIGADMYFNMHKNHNSILVNRGIALHKLIRLLTISTAGNGYLNFMGNEFGHPEWIDFPREGNNWSYNYARRQWDLLYDKELKYHFLFDFDKSFIKLFKEYKILNHLSTILLQNINDQILIFERAGCIFIFNFNPFQSFENYGFECREGNYKIILNSDAAQFGGHNRVDDKINYKTSPYQETQQLKIYIPTHTALVLKKTV